MSNASVGRNLGGKGRQGIAGRCPVCEGEFTITRKTQECCSRECYLIYWASKKLVEALVSGRAEGLRTGLINLAREKR